MYFYSFFFNYSFLKDTNNPSQNFRSNTFIQTPPILDNENDEEYTYNPRSTSFLRFGRQLPLSSSSSFLRFGRSQPNFLRFGRNNMNGGTFLRFGRPTQQSLPTDILRFGKKGEFLRFG